MSELTDCYSTDDAAAYIRKHHERRCSSGYLMKLRSLGKGPSFYRRNGQVVYERADLDQWAANPEVSGPFNKSCETHKIQKIAAATSIDCEVA
jgi:hypothetical protein